MVLRSVMMTVSPPVAVEFKHHFSMSISIDSAGCVGPDDFLGMRICAGNPKELVQQYNALVCKSRPECILDQGLSHEQLKKNLPRYEQR